MRRGEVRWDKGGGKARGLEAAVRKEGMACLPRVTEEGVDIVERWSENEGIHSLRLDG